MSSILKALKKLEAETALSEKLIGTTPPGHASPEAAKSLVLMIPSLKSVGKWGLVLFAAAFLFWLLIHFNADERSMVSREGVSPPAIPIPPEIHEIKQQAVTAAVRKPFEAPPPESNPSEMGAPPNAFPVMKEKDEIEAVVQEREETDVSGDPFSGRGGRVSEQTEKRESPSWLSLQAISWSADPKKRIAVINSAIVKEGWPVERGRLLSIGKDEVTIQADGKEWRLSFGNR